MWLHEPEHIYRSILGSQLAELVGSGSLVGIEQSFHPKYSHPKKAGISPDNWTRYAQGLPQGSTALRPKYLLSSGARVRITPGVPRARPQGQSTRSLNPYDQPLNRQAGSADSRASLIEANAL